MGQRGSACPPESQRWSQPLHGSRARPALQDAVGGRGEGTGPAEQRQAVWLPVPVCWPGRSGHRRPRLPRGAVLTQGAHGERPFLLTHVHFRVHTGSAIFGGLALSKQVCRNKPGLGRRWAPKHTRTHTHTHTSSLSLPAEWSSGNGIRPDP